MLTILRPAYRPGLKKDQSLYCDITVKNIFLVGPVYTARKTVSVRAYFKFVLNKNLVRPAYHLTSC